MKALTIGEIAKVEELSGLSATEFENDESPRALLLAAMAYVIKHREEPKLKFTDVLDMEMEEVNTIVVEFQTAVQESSKSK